MIDINRTRVKDPGFGAAKATPPDMSLEGLLLGRPDLMGVVFDQQLKPGQIDLKLLPNFELRVWWLLFIDRGYNYKDAVLTIQNYYKLFAAEYEVDGTEESYVQGLRQFFAKKIEEVIAALSVQKKLETESQISLDREAALAEVSRLMRYLVDEYFLLGESYVEWSNLASFFYYLRDCGDNLSEARKLFEKKVYANDFSLDDCVEVDAGLTAKFIEIWELIEEEGLSRSDLGKLSLGVNAPLFFRFLMIWPQLNTFLKMDNSVLPNLRSLILVNVMPNGKLTVLEKLTVMEALHKKLMTGSHSFRYLQRLDMLCANLVVILSCEIAENTNPKTVKITGKQKNSSGSLIDFSITIPC